MELVTAAYWDHSICFALVIFMKIVCFVLGYFIVRLGYKLIASGVKGEFKFSAGLGGVKTDLASVSPGLLFVLLGTALIGYAIYVDKGTHLEIKANAASLNEKPELIEHSEEDLSFDKIMDDFKNMEDIKDEKK